MDSGFYCMDCMEAIKQRNWGFELDPDYYALATARLEAAKAQISIFDEPEPTEKWEQDKVIWC